MMLVDSSVWIDHLREHATPQTAVLRSVIARGGDIATGDLILFEVLQGTRSDRHFRGTSALLATFEPLTITSASVAEAAARNYQSLRQLGVTPRRTIDTLIATRCILDGLTLLYSDSDFDPFVAHLGLRSALGLSPGVN